MPSASSSYESFSHDQAVKNLLKEYPIEALEFLAEDVVAAHGIPASVEFLDTAVAKDDTAEEGPGMAMDLAIRYVFASGLGVLFVLVEHWSDAGRLDLLRTARYYLDLCRRFPGDQILPIALVDDDHPRDLADTVRRGALEETFLSFRTRVVQVPALDLERYRETRNRVALSFTPNMRGDFDRVERVIEVAVAFQGLDDGKGYRKFFAFWVVEGRLKTEEQIALDRRLKEMDMPYIIEKWKQEGLEVGWTKGLVEGRAEGLAQGMEEGLEKGLEKGLEEGLRRKSLETAQRMLAEGFAWEVVTRITGVAPEDLTEA